jgi:hypothetical protein
VNYDVFELLSRELSVDPAVFCEKIHADVDQLSEAVQATPVFDLPLILADDLVLKGSSTPFVTRGTDVRPYMKSILSRAAGEDGFAASPQILPSDEINRYLKEKIGRAYTRLTRKLMHQRHLGRIYAIYQKNQDLNRIATCLGELIDPYLASPSIIRGVLASLTTNSDSGSVEENTRAAFVAMAILERFEAIAGDAHADRFNNLVEMGLVLIFQDIACTVDGLEHDPTSSDHTVASATLINPLKSAGPVRLIPNPCFGMCAPNCPIA